MGRVRACRAADLADAMDALGLVNTGSMSPAMRPIRPGLRMAGLAYTVQLLPAQVAARPCATIAEYWEALNRWCEDTYAFTAGLRAGEGRESVVVIDMGGCPGGIWGSAIGLDSLKWGVVGAVIDGGCRDSAECNGEQLAVWCTVRTSNHVYARVVNGGVNVAVRCAGVTVYPRDVVCGDDDGVVVIPQKHAREVVTFAEAIHEADQRVRAQGYRDLGLTLDESLGPHGAEPPES